MNREWHQSAWKYLNYLQGVQNGNCDNQRTETAGNQEDVLDGKPSDGRDSGMGGSSVKTKLAIAIVAWSVCFILTTVYACPKGSTEWRDGVCTVEIKAEGASPDESAKWVSNEKAPGKGHQQDWQTGKVKTDNLQNTDVAARTPPDSCKGKNQVWTGSQCLEGQDPTAGKAPK